MSLTMIRDLGSRMQKAPCCCCMGSRSIKEKKIIRKVGWTRRIDKTWSLGSVREKAGKEHRLWMLVDAKGGSVTAGSYARLLVA